MATYQLAVNNTEKRWPPKARRYELEALADFSVQNLAQNDILEVLNIPADTIVYLVTAKVEQVEGEAATIDIGDGADVDGFLDGISVNALDVLSDTDAVYIAAQQGKHYPAADTIDIKAVDAVTYNLGKVRIRAYCIDVS